jgi:hypothetical protein
MRPALVLLACLLACQGPRAAPDPASSQTGEPSGSSAQLERPAQASGPREVPRPVRSWTPPADWATRSRESFEALVLAELPDGVTTRLPVEAMPDLRRALHRMNETSVRAAVLLGRSRTERTAEALLERLERRVLGPALESDAADVTAAAALGRFPAAARYARRLVPLAVGNAPHPDLEVRVECAITALGCGHDEVIPFLLKVLRIDTWEGQQDERDFATGPQTAWARSRAAEALSARAGVPCTYPADGSVQARQDEAQRLAELLGAGG